MSEPLTPEEFHDAWVLRGMRCEGTHAVNEALCQNIMAVLATLDAERAAPQPDSLDVERLRKAVHDLIATVAFLCSVAASGEQLSTDDLTRMGEVYESARAALAKEPTDE